jgi:general secretion pathway protein L
MIIIGLDIGQQAVRGVRISQGFGRLRVLDTFGEPVARTPEAGLFDWPSGEQTQALKSLAKNFRSSDAIAVSLPAALVCTRRITLPFTHPEKLRQALPYEMENHLPFDVQDVVIDYQLLATPDSTSASLWVGACPRTVLQRSLSRLREAGVDPTWAGVEGFSLYRLHQQFGKKAHGSVSAVLMVDVGASKTTLCDIQQHVRAIRTIPMGGDQITEAIAATHHLSWEDAERRKKGRASDLTDLLPTLQEALAPWLLEIEKSLRSEPTESPRFYWLTGGGAGAVDAVLSATLGMKPLSLDLPVAPHFAQGLGTALSRRSINFRRGEAGMADAPKRGRWATVVLSLLLLIGLIVSDIALYAYQKEAAYQTRKTGLRRAFLELFPQAQNAPDEVEHTRAQVAKLSRTVGTIFVGEQDPLWVLNEIASGIPTPIEIQEMTIDGETARIEAYTDSYLSIEKIRDGLMKRAFHEIKISDAKVTADQSKVHFRIQINLRGVQEKGR